MGTRLRGKRFALVPGGPGSVLMKSGSVAIRPTFTVCKGGPRGTYVAGTSHGVPDHVNW